MGKIWVLIYSNGAYFKCIKNQRQQFYRFYLIRKIYFNLLLEDFWNNSKDSPKPEACKSGTVQDSNTGLTAGVALITL